MILDEMILHNFGVYKGRQRFNLTPVSNDRPIILLGAMNGNGKTTFLNALQLAFFGKLAPVSGREGGTYSDYLRRSINRSVPEAEGAAVEVSFRRFAAGQEQHFRLHRSWSSSSDSVREKFTVITGDREDRALTDQWAEYLEEVLPYRIAPLFFFDGEKIEEFADPDRSSEILRTAIYSLLGLDIVERLSTDLEVFERRNSLNVKETSDSPRVDTATAELGALENILRQLRDKRAALQNQYDRSLKLIADAQAHFRNEGGDLYEQRSELAILKVEIDARITISKKALGALAAEAAPLLLVTDLLDAVAKQNMFEEVQEQKASVLKVLDKRDASVLAQLQRHKAASTLISAMKTFLETDRRQLRQEGGGKSYLGLSIEGRRMLSILHSGGLEKVVSSITGAVAELDSLQEELATIERKLASVPDESALGPLIQQITASEAEAAKLRIELKNLDVDLGIAERDLALKRASITKLLEQELYKTLENEDRRRMVSHSFRAREKIGDFRARVTAHHIARLERLIVECFSKLVSKEALVTQVKIDPNTFQMELRDGDANIIPAERLSAGERQLFAISLLWALGRASGIPAPAVIDTPLGRLDSVHRLHLIDRYFPKASHQVLLLSTDEEIDEDSYARLAPKISRSFRVEFDAVAGASTVREGYFFDRSHQ